MEETTDHIEKVTIPLEEYRELIANKALSRFVISAAEKDARSATDECQAMKSEISELKEENENLKARLYTVLEENRELKAAGAGEEYEPI